MLGRQWSVVERQVFMPGLRCFRNISWLFFAFGGIAGCGSASLKLCAFDAAYPWSQSPFPDSQCVDTWHQGATRASKSCNHATTWLCKIFMNLRKWMWNRRKITCTCHILTKVFFKFHMFYVIYNACFCANLSISAFYWEFSFRKSGGNHHIEICKLLCKFLNKYIIGHA